ncbi:hypothetical protein YC2023_033091 [Brassica napus]
MGLTVKWVYTDLGRWVRGSNLQLPSLNDGIVSCRPSSLRRVNFSGSCRKPCVSRFEGVFLCGSSRQLVVHSVCASSSDFLFHVYPLHLTWWSPSPHIDASIYLVTSVFTTHRICLPLMLQLLKPPSPSQPLMPPPTLVALISSLLDIDKMMSNSAHIFP